jgi:hypothetical protein
LKITEKGENFMNAEIKHIHHAGHVVTDMSAALGTALVFRQA